MARLFLSPPALAAPLALAGLLAAPAAAEIAAEEAWLAFRDQLAALGYRVEGEALRRDGALRIAGARAVLDLPRDGGSVEIGLGDLVLSERGDGGVAVTLPASQPITARIAEPEGGESVLRFDFSHSDLDLAVTGSAEAPRYEYRAARLGLSLEEMRLDGQSLSRDAADLRLDLAEVAGRTGIAEAGGSWTVSHDLTAAEARYALAFAEAETGEGVALSGTLRDAAAEIESRLPPGQPGEEHLGRLLADGLTATGRLAFAAGSSEFTATEQGRSTSGSTSSGGGALNLALDAQGLSYGARTTDVTWSMILPGLPFAVGAEIAELGAELTLPLEAAETPQPAALALTLSELMPSEAVWALIDPAGALPRAPATARLDLAAEVTPFVDLLDPAAVAARQAEDQPVAELNTLTLERLDLAAAGAELTGTGAFTFDNADTETFDGMPAPEGEARFTLAGADALIDALVGMGLLPESQAMGARMMLSMFAVPAGEDRVTSTITINDQGQILANGQRIR
ncbi:DUF2125 domain-containing protein [Roseivivax sp. CAU 1761]